MAAGIRTRNNFKSLKERKLPVLDRAYSALLQDLHDRGLLDSKLVVLVWRFRPDAEDQSVGGPRTHWATGLAWRAWAAVAFGSG